MELNIIESDWGNLPEHILHSILEKIQSSIDYLQFSVVCAPWHSAAKNNKSIHIQKLSHHHVPMLFFPPKRRKSNTWSIYSILEKKFLETKVLLPRFGRRYFGGSSEGWLATIDKKFAVTLYKPFMKHKRNEIINLPSLCLPNSDEEEEEEDDEEYYGHRYFEEYISKVTTFTSDLVANPSDLVCVVIFGGLCQLAYIRANKDTTWTHFANCVDQVGFDDVVYYNHQFYALTCRGKLTSFDTTYPNLKLVVSGTPRDDEEKDFCYKRYLVEYEGELLQIQRYSYIDRYTSNHFNNMTKKFKVFKLSFDGPRWIETKNLGDMALFLGDNSSISVLASNFAGCQRNCIYFTQDRNSVTLGNLGPKDLGVYDLESGSLTTCFTIDATIFPKVRRRPIWIVPPLSMC